MTFPGTVAERFRSIGRHPPRRKISSRATRVLAHELSVTPAELAIETDEQADQAAAEQTESLLEGEGHRSRRCPPPGTTHDFKSFVTPPKDLSEWDSLGIVPATQTDYEATGLNKAGVYVFRIRAIGLDG